jgi:histidinol-phosphatase
MDFAVETAEAAGKLAAQLFFDQSPARRKADGTEVTDADVIVEDFIRDALARHAPEDAVLGEEAGLTTGTSGRRWVIDPISGTAYFARRMPQFATLLAYEDEDGSAIGVIAAPMARETVFAGRGLGCWVAQEGGDVRRARLSGHVELDGALTLAANQHTFSDELLATLHRRTTLVGGIHHPVAHLLTGRVDAVVMTCQGQDDLAPVPVLLAEAGGTVTELGGGPVRGSGPLPEHGGTLLAANPELHRRLLAATAGLTATRRPKALR